MDKKKITIVYVITTAMILGILGYTYAYFSATVKENNKTETVIKTDELTLVFTGTNEITTGDNMIPGDSFAKTFTVENTSDVDTKYNIYMKNITNEFNEDLVYVLSDEDGIVVEETPLPVTNVGKSYLISDIDIKAGELKTYTLKIEYKYLDTPQNDYQGSTFKGTVGVDANKIGNILTPDIVEEYITMAYTYNEDSTASNYCVTGEEETCVETTCYESIEANSCASGTIVDYKVNDIDTVRFHVIHDDGVTMTIQSQKNTVYNIAWYGTEQEYTNANGPMTILPVLEEKTSDWTNVNPQTYTMGTTTFKTNSFTGCSSYSSCTTNTYTLPERTANARMITLQEAANLGCTTSNSSCPIWVYNYTYDSINYGGTVNDTTTENGASSNGGYWTMNVNSSDNERAYQIGRVGKMDDNLVYRDIYGARAVVEINK